MKKRLKERNREKRESYSAIYCSEELHIVQNENESTLTRGDRE